MQNKKHMILNLMSLVFILIIYVTPTYGSSQYEFNVSSKDRQDLTSALKNLGVVDSKGCVNNYSNQPNIFMFLFQPPGHSLMQNGVPTNKEVWASNIHQSGSRYILTSKNPDKFHSHSEIFPVSDNRDFTDYLTSVCAAVLSHTLFYPKNSERVESINFQMADIDFDTSDARFVSPVTRTHDFEPIKDVLEVNIITQNGDRSPSALTVYFKKSIGIVGIKNGSLNFPRVLIAIDQK